MNSDQDFEDLRRLLSLKKYEQPPPRYFSDLPSRIWVRIEREDQSPSFWARLFPNLGLNPALAYSFGLLACGTLVFGIGYGLNTDQEQTASGPLVNEGLMMAAPKLANGMSSQLSLSNFQATQLASTNPVMNTEPLPSLFNSYPSVQVAPVNYSPGR